MLPGFLHFSPTNKDRPEHRGEFIAKCAAMLRSSVSFTIVEDVTTPSATCMAISSRCSAKWTRPRQKGGR
jgi:hypothetical protein